MIRIKIRKEIDRKKYLLFAILSFVIVLAAWLIASESGAIKEIFLPKPQNVVNLSLIHISLTANGIPHNGSDSISFGSFSM